jgi:hypothetical protein
MNYLMTRSFHKRRNHQLANYNPYLIFTHNLSQNVKKILFSLTKTHVDNKRKNKKLELLLKGKMAGKG